MPVVWHERKGKEFNRIVLKPLAKDANERFLVFRFMKNFLPRISTIDRVTAFSPPRVAERLRPRLLVLQRARNIQSRGAFGRDHGGHDHHQELKNRCPGQQPRIDRKQDRMTSHWHRG